MKAQEQRKSINSMEFTDFQTHSILNQKQAQRYNVWLQNSCLDYQIAANDT
jgi:hypothetical protein